MIFNRCATRIFKTCHTHLVRGTDFFSFRFSNKTKMTTANITIAIWCEWVKIITIFFVRLAKSIFFVCHRILVISVSVPWDEKLKSLAWLTPFLLTGTPWGRYSLSPFFRWGSLSHRGVKWLTQGHPTRFTAGGGKLDSEECLNCAFQTAHSISSHRVCVGGGSKSTACHTPALAHLNTIWVPGSNSDVRMGNTGPGETLRGSTKQESWGGGEGHPRTKRKPGLLDGKETPLESASRPEGRILKFSAIHREIIYLYVPNQATWFEQV